MGAAVAQAMRRGHWARAEAQSARGSGSVMGATGAVQWDCSRIGQGESAVREVSGRAVAAAAAEF